MPRPPKPKVKSTGSSTKVKVEQPALYDDYVQLKIEGIDFSSLALDKKSISSDIAVDLVAFEPKQKQTSKPKQRKFSWWEIHPLFPPGTEVDLLESWSNAFSDEVEQIWLSGYWVYDPMTRRTTQPVLRGGGLRPVGICIDPLISKVVFYPQEQVRVHIPGTPHYSEIWQSR